MTKNIYSIIFLLACLATNLNGQTTILDFEGATTTTGFQYFGNGALDGAMTTLIANPNPTGVNTSANVIEYVKDAAALTWAGCFSTPNPTVPVDLTVDDQICVNVHMDHIGNVALKLENSATGDNWIIQRSNTVVGQWEELCFDATLPSVEAPMTAAAGHVYATVVFFFDFNVAGTGTNVTSYIDNFETSVGGGAVPADVTFAADMNEYAGSFSNVFVSGSFNSWCADCDTLTDPDSDGVYTGTVNMLTGSYEYKFVADATYEELSFLDECIVTDSSGSFANRNMLVTGNEVRPTTCFESCYECGDEVSITFELGMAAVTVDAGGVYIAGGGNFDGPGGRFELKDDDGDDVYTITVQRQKGFSSFYTFANGNCPDYSCKEDIEGQACANPANFNDRDFDAVSADTTISTCFGMCTDVTTDCMSVSMGIEDLPAANVFTLQPTITSGEISGQLLSPANETVSLKLIDMTGKVLTEKLLNAGEQNFDFTFTAAPAGLYMVHMSTANSTATQTIIKR